MRMLPVVARELGSIARRKSSYYIRSASALAAFVAMAIVLLLGHAAPINQGQSLFHLLSLAAFAYCLAAGIRGTSDALSEEKREGTLGLLFLTDLKGYDVVFGKFVSLSINSLYGILAIVPALALAFLLGGTSSYQFLMMSACLLNTLFFSLAAGIFVSTFCQNDRQAMGGTLAIVFLAAVLPYALAAAHAFGDLDIWEVMLPGFLLSSPVFAFRTAGEPNLVFFLRDELLLSMAFTHLLAWLGLIVASACIAGRAHQEAPQGRLARAVLELRMRLAYGKAQQRRALRAGALDRNAFYWLAGRDLLKRRYTWVFLGLLCVGWVIGWRTTPDVLNDWPVMIGFLWFVHLFFKVWAASEVAARFIEDRRSNALELLLTTPLGLKEIARGQWLSLARQFAGPVALLICLSLLTAAKAAGTFGYTYRSVDAWKFALVGIAHLLADLYTIHWVGIWRSLHSRGTNRVIAQTVLLVIIIPAFSYFLLSQGSWVFSLVFGTQMLTGAKMLLTWSALCLSFDAMLVMLARRAFFDEFRETATQAFDRPTKAAKAPREALVKKRRPIWRWRLATVGLAVVLVFLAGTAFRRHQMKKLVATQIAKIRADGLPASPGEIPAWRTNPPDNQSLLPVLRAAQKALGAGTRVPNLRSSFDRNSFGQVAKLQFLSMNAEAFRILAELPRVQSAWQSEEDRIRHPVEINQFVDVLEMKANFELDDKSPAAAETISLLLHLARVAQGQTYSHPNLRGSLAAAGRLMERVASERRFSEKEWRAWQTILERIDPFESLKSTYIIERAYGLEKFRQSNDYLYQNYGRMMMPMRGIFDASMAIRRLIAQDQAEILIYLKHMESGIESATEGMYRSVRGARRQRRFAPNLLSATLIADHLMPPIGFLGNAAAARLTQVRLLHTAAAVEIYRARYGGKLPETVTNLSVGAISAMPIDPFTHSLLNYKVEKGGYVIYSAGEDRRNTSSSRVNRDLTFRCVGYEDQ